MIIAALVGKTIKEIVGVEKGSEQIVFTCEDSKFLMYHEQDCCERVDLEDFEGDVGYLKGALILSAEEVFGEHEPHQGSDDSYTWTFYKIETSKGGLWLRWLGESNGYYGESVDFKQVY